MRRKKNFLAGRNGPDALSMALSFLACILLVIAMLSPQSVTAGLWLVAFFCLVFAYVRIFSRNIPRRQAENQWFLHKVQPVRSWILRRQQRKRQKNLYCFFKCPQCGTVLRVPKGKGRIRITCRSCSHVFERTS